MKYTFHYEETLSRKVEIDAKDLGSALANLYQQIDSQEIVLSGDDFLTARITAPLDENRYSLGIENCGEAIDPNKRDYEIILDAW